jgi:AraC-like DNA-binding protein/ligand-binding sensor protein
MTEKATSSVRSILKHHPLLIKIADMALKEARIRMNIVFPDETGWVQCLPGGRSGFPDFCSMIQGSPEGAKQCKMCHILMTVAACSSGAREQKCHAGACSIVCPINPPGHEQSQAVLSSCTFIEDNRDEVWKTTEARGRQLGLDIDALKKSFYSLPLLTRAEVSKVHELLAIAAEAIKVLFSQCTLQEQLNTAKDRTRPAASVQAAVTEKLKERAVSLGSDGKANSKSPRLPPIIGVIQETVNRRPDFQYNVREIAAAARMTPNHFSALFRKHTGRTFSDFVTARRIAKAKQLLGDFTMNVSEIAGKVGFEDAGYFSRRFRQVEGCSPREWRDKLR